MKEELDGSASGLPDASRLKPFCSIDESRKLLMEPYSLDGFTYATDGQIAVRVVGEEGKTADAADAKDLYGKVRDIIDAGKAIATTWVRLTKVPAFEVCETCKGAPPPDHEVDCPECDGDGEVHFSTSHNEYECDCLTCDGDGKVTQEGCEDCGGTGRKTANKSVYCGIQGVWLNLILLDRIKSFPGLRLGLHEPRSLNAHYFTWDGGDGVLMPLRPMREDDEDKFQAHIEYELDGVTVPAAP